VIVLLNGPIGIGKSSLAEALAESIDLCVMLDGDWVAATTPAASTEHLHSTIALLVAHHRSFGFRHFVVNHIWTTPVQLTDLRDRLTAADDDIRTFLLTLSAEENWRRIERRAQARALDERDFARRAFAEERAALEDRVDVGEPFDVTAPLEQLVAALRSRLGLRSSAQATSRRAT
jgi:hypothetical protein